MGDIDTDMGEQFRAMKKERQQTSSTRRDRATSEYTKAWVAAEAGGFRLCKNSETHYTLKKKAGWSLQVYPGNQRIYRQPGSGAPHPDLPQQWGLIDVVRAALEADGPTEPKGEFLVKEWFGLRIELEPTPDHFKPLVLDVGPVAHLG